MKVAPRVIMSFTRDSYTISSSSSPTRREPAFSSPSGNNTLYMPRSGCVVAGNRQQLSARSGGQYPGLPVPDQFGAKSRKIARGIAPGKHIQRGVKNTSWQIFPRCGTANAGVPFVYLVMPPSPRRQRFAAQGRRVDYAAVSGFPACLRTYTLQ